MAARGWLALGREPVLAAVVAVAATGKAVTAVRSPFQVVGLMQRPAGLAPRPLVVALVLAGAAALRSVSVATEGRSRCMEGDSPQEAAGLAQAAPELVLVAEVAAAFTQGSGKKVVMAAR